MTPFFVIVGPTAVGKSELAVQVAERCGADIVGADAFQIYRGLEVLTAKPDAALRERVPHHLVGEIPLTEPFDTAKYLIAANQRMEEIRARGRNVIVVGGTGLYVRALMHGLADVPAADENLRAELNAQPLAALVERLTQLDPDGGSFIDIRNPRRVVRALEICLLTGRPFSSFREEWKKPAPLIRGVVLARDRAELYTRIDARTHAMFAAGVENEVRDCGEIGPTAAQTIGLREIRALIAGMISRPECIASIQQATRHYAKRQGTWFRRETAFTQIDLSREKDASQLVERLARDAFS